MPKTALQSIPRDHALAGQWIHAFNAGPQTDSRGNTRHWTVDELDQMVASFDAQHPPKHVIEHSELYSPFAFGDISEIKRDGDALFVRSEKVSEQLDQLLDSGAINERSIRIEMDGDGRFKVGHLAWLGAKPPAVAGLEPVRIDHSAADTRFDYAFKEERKLGLLKRLWRAVREMTIAQHGSETADRYFPEYELDQIDDLQIDEAIDTRTPKAVDNASGDDAPPRNQFSQQEPPVPDTKTPAADDAAKRDAELRADFEKKRAEDAARIAALEYQARVRDARELVRAAVAEGRLTPAAAEGYAEFMAQQPDDAAQTFSFSRAGDGDKATTEKMTAFGFAKHLLTQLPKQVKTDATDTGGDEPAPADHEAVAKKALEYQKAEADKGRQISISAAVAHVQANQE